MAKHPDVVVLGMPSSGKTVFLSVLGRTFTRAAQNDISHPLGFRMCAADESTGDMVAANYTELETGHWPHNTLEGQITPLHWDVYTGKRRLFDLSSMDISGETFRKAFGQKGTSRSSKSYEDDALLGDNDSARNSADKAVGILREDLLHAKAICLFVNIALPRQVTRMTRDERQKRDEQLKNFREAVAKMCTLLRQHRELLSKIIVVLTHAHRFQEEILQAGGPDAYLRGRAQDLFQLVSDNNIPVISVSAVNEESEANQVPAVIQSDGLFGFLLMVSGMAAGGNIAKVKDAYKAYLQCRTQAYQRPCRLLGERLPRYENFRKAGLAFHAACMDYLRVESNICDQSGNDDAFYRAVIDDYVRSTDADPTIAEARHGWEGRLEIDQVWDANLKANAWDVLQGAPSISPDQLYAQVKNQLAQLNSMSDKGLSEIRNDANIYGFTEDQLQIVHEAEDYEDWTRKSEVQYRENLEVAIERNRKAVHAFSASVDEFAESPLDYNQRAIDSIKWNQNTINRELAGLKSSLPARGNALPPMLQNIFQAMTAACAKLDQTLKRRAKEIERQAKAEQRRAARKSALKTLRSILSGFLAIIVFALILYGIWYYLRFSYITSNEALVEQVKELTDHGDYKGAEARIAELKTLPAFRVDGTTLLPNGFPASLRAAADLKSSLESAKQQMDSFNQLRKQKLPLDRDTSFAAKREVDRATNSIDTAWAQLPSLPNYQLLAKSPQAASNALKVSTDFLASLQTASKTMYQAIEQSDKCRQQREAEEREKEEARKKQEEAAKKRQAELRQEKVNAATQRCQNFLGKAMEAAESAKKYSRHDKSRVITTLTCEKLLADALKQAKKELDGEEHLLTAAHYHEFCENVQSIRKQLPTLIQVKVFSGSDKNHPGEPVNVTRFNPVPSNELNPPLEDLFVIIDSKDLNNQSLQPAQSCAYLEIPSSELTSGSKFLMLRLKTDSGRVIPFFVPKKDLAPGINHCVRYLRTEN